MIFRIIKKNKLARITTIITSFTVLVCIIVGAMIVRLSDKIQDTKVSIKQNSLNTYKIEQLLREYQQIEVKTLGQIERSKQILEKENIVDLIKLMEKIALENKIKTSVQLEGGKDIADLSNEIIYNIRFQTQEPKMKKYLASLENIPYVSQIIQFQSSLNVNNNELIKQDSEQAVIDKINTATENSDQSYALRLKVFLE